MSFDRRAYMKKYRENNKDKMKEYMKDYRENNQDKLKEYAKDYRENNINYMKKYRENNQDKIKEYRENKNNQDKMKEYRENNKNRRKAINKKLKEIRALNPPIYALNCYVCNCLITDKNKISHHVSYFPEKEITVCRGCHISIHHQKNHELVPSKKSMELFYLS